MKYILMLFLLFVALVQAKMVDAVAVVVGDDIITLYDITKEMRTSHVSKKQAIEILIRKKLEQHEIKKRGIEVSEDEVFDEIRRLASGNHMSISRFYDVVRESNGLDSTQLKEQIKQRLLSQKLYRKIAMMKLKEPSDSELEEYFRLHKEEFVHPQFFDVTVYVAPSEALLLQKVNNPMFFSAQIKEDSRRVAYEKLPQPLAHLLSDTKEGAFTQIVPNGKGEYMTFYVQKRGPLGEADFEQVKPLVENAVMNERRVEILDDYFAKLKDSIDVKVL